MTLRNRKTAPSASLETCRISIRLKQASSCIIVEFRTDVHTSPAEHRALFCGTRGHCCNSQGGKSGLIVQSLSRETSGSNHHSTSAGRGCTLRIPGLCHRVTTTDGCARYYPTPSEVAAHKAHVLCTVRGPAMCSPVAAEMCLAGRRGTFAPNLLHCEVGRRASCQRCGAYCTNLLRPTDSAWNSYGARSTVTDLLVGHQILRSPQPVAMPGRRSTSGRCARAP